MEEGVLKGERERDAVKEWRSAKGGIGCRSFGRLDLLLLLLWTREGWQAVQLL